MSVSYIGLNIKDFIANTVRLNTEAKGAYLMLLLDYYEQEEGAPADPDVLATVTHLTLEAWERHARVILPLFEIRDGRLYQQRVEDEIAKAYKRISQATGAAAVAKAARDARKASRQTTSQVTSENTSSPKPKIQTDDLAGDLSDIRPGKSIREIISQFTAPVSSEESVKDTQYTGTIEEVSANALTSAGAGAETLLPEDFALTAEAVIRCQNDGATVEQISAIFDGWKLRMLAAGAFSDDWWAVWWKRWERDKPVKPPPRIEVSNKRGKPIPADWKPNESHEAIAIERNLNIGDQEQRFRDYCASTGKLYKDHDAAFRNWLRSDFNAPKGPTHAATATRRAPPPGRGSIVSAADEAIANLERKIADGDEGG